MMYYNAFLGSEAKEGVATEEEKMQLKNSFVRFFAVSLDCVNKYAQISDNKEVLSTLVDAFNRFVEETKSELGYLHNFYATMPDQPKGPEIIKRERDGKEEYEKERREDYY